jgi:hypothetical protein
MGYSVRNGRLGFECEVCGDFSDLRLTNLCGRCIKRICWRCSIAHVFPDKLPPRFFRYRRIEMPSYVCPECNEELENEEIEAQAEKEEESSRPITKCALCTATDEPPEHKTFGYRPPTFSNCERCGKLVCDQCRISVYDPYYDYDIVCRECYSAKEQEDKRKREEYWREEEENKLEE